MIALIITLVLILLILVAGIILYFYVRNKVRNVSRELFGTSDITQAAQQMKQEYATTPKSVSAMTSLLLPKIVSDHPDFQYDEMKERANALLVEYLQAVNAGSTEPLRDGTEELTQQLIQQIRSCSSQNQKEHFSQIHLHRTEICQYRTTAGRHIITFQTSLECYHYITDASGAVIEGSKDYMYQTRYNTDLIYIQNRDIVTNASDNAAGATCPNCGAPYSSLKSRSCPYCGTPLIEFNIQVWSFNNIEEIH